jgi:hypothetical protein
MYLSLSHVLDYKNFQDICVNKPSTTLHEEGVMCPKLPIEHRVDDNRTFLTTLIIYIYMCVYIYIFQSPY